MTIEENKEIALKFIKTLATCNIDKLLEMMADSAIWHVPGKPENFALAGPKTKSQLREILIPFFAQMPEGMKLVPCPSGITAEADRVAVEAESWAKMESGKIYNNQYHFLFTVREGKIHEVKEYLDTLHVKEIMFG